VIALVMLFATLAVIFYAFNRGLPFVHHYTLYAVVNNSVNVRSDSPVRIAGIDVGSVDSTSPEGNATKIQFTVGGNGLPIHKDATVRVRDRLFLEGGYYLELDPGTPSAPTLHDGDAIPLSQTSTPVQFYKVLSTFDVAARASLRNLLDSLNQGFSPQPGHPLSDSGAGAFKSAIPQLQPVLRGIAWTSQGLRGTQPGDVQKLLSSGSDVFSTLADNSRQLADLVTNLNRTSTALATADGALAQSISAIDHTLQTAPSALSAIDRSLPPLANLATALDPSLKVAPPLVDSVTSSVRQLAAVVAPAERTQLLSSLKATFQQFPALLTQLGTAFPITKQVTDCLQTNVVPARKAPGPAGPGATGRPVWQDFVHFLPGLAGASGSFDANGPFVRALAGAGTNTLTGGLLPNIPLIGQIVGAAPPGNSSLLGARPSWVGDLAASDFRPDARCATQRVPNLASPTAPVDLHPSHSSATATQSKAQLFDAVTRLIGRQRSR
jgi:virulence factor Mce-like protein